MGQKHIHLVKIKPREKTWNFDICTGLLCKMEALLEMFKLPFFWFVPSKYARFCAAKLWIL